MSTVTNIILATELGESGAVQDVNRRYRILAKQSNVVIFSSAVDYEQGGNKNLEVSVYLSAVNSLNRDALIQAIKDVVWSYPESVQLFLKGQDDTRFQYIMFTQGGENEDVATTH